MSKIETAPTTNKIEVLEKVYYVNGAFYRTESEASLSLIKGELYDTWLERSGYSILEKSRMKKAGAAANYANNYVYIDDVVRLLAEKGVTFPSLASKVEEPSA